MQENQTLINDVPTGTSSTTEIPPTETQPTVSPPPKKSKKPLLLGLFALSLILVGVSGYFVYQKYQIKGPISSLSRPQLTQPTPTPDPTADWETYTNTTYGYSLKYPPLWTLITPGPSAETTTLSEIRKNPDEYRLHNFSIESFSGSTEENLKPFKKSTESWTWQGKPTTKEIAVSGIKGWIKEGLLPDEQGNIRWRKYILILNKNTLYKIIWNDTTDRSEETTFNQILSSFKFLPEDCQPCPQFTSPHPDFCKDGTIIPGEVDKCGCQGPPKCQRSGSTWLSYTSPQVVDFFKTFTIYYPDSWEMNAEIIRKEHPGVFEFEISKPGVHLHISQVAGGTASCLYPQDPELEGMYARFGEYKEIQKENEIIWRRAMPKNLIPDAVQYHVCEKGPDDTRFGGFTSIGLITLSDSFVITEPLLNEFDEILERIEILE